MANISNWLQHRYSKDVEGVTDNAEAHRSLPYRSSCTWILKTSQQKTSSHEAYKAVRGMNGKPVVVRTMDIGGDKELPYFDMPHEMNPFLDSVPFVSLFTNWDAMFHTNPCPSSRLFTVNCVSCSQWLRFWKNSVQQAVLTKKKANLLEGWYSWMISKLASWSRFFAAAMLADQFAKEVDFFSIGTNDLIQYLWQQTVWTNKFHTFTKPYNPSILRLINNVIKAAHAEGNGLVCVVRWLDQKAVPLLVGMGLDEFSMISNICTSYT